MNIDRLARWYRWIEYAAFGRALERRRFAFLHRLATARRVLILGEGDGRTLERLLALAPQARIDVVELSIEMIALAQSRVAIQDRVRFLQQDALSSSWPERHYNAVVTCFFLDCFAESQARSLIHGLAAAMAPGAVWLVSEFAVPPHGWRKLHAKLWLSTMYRFFKITTGLQTHTLPPYERLLSEAGMQRTESEHERAGMMVSEVWEKRR
jgi:ubiquinone/menaquinone biosynthesis C-methylase UbiE